jgi:hypothetical protein
MAVYHAMCGEFDRAAEWTARAFEERYPNLIKIIRPLLQETPYWQAIARMMNLPR